MKITLEFGPDDHDIAWIIRGIVDEEEKDEDVREVTSELGFQRNPDEQPETDKAR